MTGLKFNDLEALNIEIMKHTDARDKEKEDSDEKQRRTGAYSYERIFACE